MPPPGLPSGRFTERATSIPGHKFRGRGPLGAPRARRSSRAVYQLPHRGPLLAIMGRTRQAAVSTSGVMGVTQGDGGFRCGDQQSVAIKWFGGGKKPPEPREHSIDDLIVLEQYEEAGERLRARLKDHPDDLHSHLKLAEVYTQLQQFARAVDEYGFVAEEYAQDG